MANPVAYQRVVDRVKPERDHNNRASIRELWWRFGWERPLLRKALIGLKRYIGTTETAKHRVFQFIDGDVLADHMVICIALDSAALLGLLSSRLHVAWALAAGGTLEDRPRYNKIRCLETFPAPDELARLSNVAQLAEQIDTHRKRQQSQHADLTLTGLYNVLENLRSGEPLTAKEKTIHDHGLVSVLRELHDDLDRAVFAAYGWHDLAAELVGRPGATTPLPDKPAAQAAAEEELLARLVRLNAERAAEEARGLVRWLRPEFQAQQPAAAQTEIADEEAPAAPRPAAVKRAPWPATLPEQIRLVADTVAQSARPLDLDQLAAHFTGRGPWKKRLPEIVDSLAALGRVKLERSGERVVLHG
ncbi:MAG: type IIL restriction-modification enzyme MmeI [Burkholderiaceae bacterium]|nr:type IIL restriction-modification enzyme MmeI [Burkholderiaceae bacterium]